MWLLYKRQDEKIKSKTKDEPNRIIGEYFRLKDQNSQNSDRLDELKTFVYGFMDDQKVERVFSEEGYLTRTIKKKYLRFGKNKRNIGINRQVEGNSRAGREKSGQAPPLSVLTKWKKKSCLLPKRKNSNLNARLKKSIDEGANKIK